MINKRKFARLPIINDFAMEISITSGKESFSGVVLNLSAGGMLLLSYCYLSVDKEINLILDLPNISTKMITGKILRCTEKKGMFEVGVQFTKISSADAKKINKVAQDFVDCENKIDLGVSDVCNPDCSYFQLCDKSQKI